MKHSTETDQLAMSAYKAAAGLAAHIVEVTGSVEPEMLRKVRQAVNAGCALELIFKFGDGPEIYLAARDDAGNVQRVGTIPILFPHRH